MSARYTTAFTIVPIITLEDYGFCAKGEGGAFVADGRTGPDGSLPMNTGGGLLSESGMAGMQLLVEGVRQLRGANAATGKSRAPRPLWSAARAESCTPTPRQSCGDSP